MKAILSLIASLLILLYFFWGMWMLCDGLATPPPTPPKTDTTASKSINHHQ